MTESLAPLVPPRTRRWRREEGLDIDIQSTYGINMKAIQITVDERLLKDLDEDEEVKRHGRSAVMRRAVFEYLRKRRRKKIADAYRQAYGGRRATDVDWIGWTGSAWPDE